MQDSEIEFVNKIILSQFQAAMMMLRINIRDCPEEVWELSLWPDPYSEGRLSQYWYILFHCLFWADLYLEGDDRGFAPPAPFTLDELNPNGIVPATPYDIDTLLSYCDKVEKKGETILLSKRTSDLQSICEFSWGVTVSYGELVIDIIRHIQEHSAQCSMFLGQMTNYQSKWVSSSKKLDEKYQYW